MRRRADVDVRAGGRTRYRVMKSGEGNSVAPEICHQRLSFDALRIDADIHRVAMIQTPAIM